MFYHVYFATHDAPARWVYANATGPVACIWDAAVIAHERQAWVSCVLANPDGPDLDAYLNARLNTEV